MRDPLQRTLAAAVPARTAGEAGDSDLFAELRSYLSKHPGGSGRHAFTELVRALYLDASAFYFDSLEPLDPAGRKLAGALIQAKLADIYPLDAWENAYRASLELDQPRKNASSAPTALAPEPSSAPREEEAVEEPLVEPAAAAAGAHVIGEVEIVDERPEPSGDATFRQAPQRAPGTSRSAKAARLLGLLIALAAAALVLAVPMGPSIQGALSEWGAITFLSKHALDAAVEPQVEAQTAESTAPQNKKVVRSVERPQPRNATVNEASTVAQQSVRAKEITGQPQVEDIQSAPPLPASTLQTDALNPLAQGPRGRTATLPDSTSAQTQRQSGGLAADAVKAQRDRPEPKTLATAAPTTLGKKSATSAAKAFDAEQTATGSSALSAESSSLDASVGASALDPADIEKGAAQQTAIGAGQSAVNSGPNGGHTTKRAPGSGKQIGQPAATTPVALAPSSTAVIEAPRKPAIQQPAFSGEPLRGSTRSATSGPAKPEPPASVRMESPSSGSGSMERIEVAPVERVEKVEKPATRAEKVEPVQREPLQRGETIQRVETRVENSGPSERAVRPEPIQKLERIEVPKIEKIERVELPKIEKIERVELPKIEKPERVEVSKIEKPERVEVPKIEKIERVEVQKVERVQRIELPVKVERVERVELPVKVERVERVELPVKVERVERVEVPKVEKPEKVEKAVRPEKPDRSGKS